MFRTPCRLDIVHAVVDTDLLSGAAQCFLRRDVAAELSGVQALNGDPILNTSLARYLRRVIAGAMAVPSALTAEAVQADIRAEVIRRLVAIVESAGSNREPSRPALKRRRRIVEAIDTFVREHPDVPFTKLDLCRIAHASQRTLDYAFKDFYGMSPAAYLKTARMNAVRRALLEAHRGEDTITGMAAGFGFWHMGHFARDYKRLFGESPSVTLSQSE
jgi:AraC family ethanolamine operon transcriptional activator